MIRIYHIATAALLLAASACTSEPAPQAAPPVVDSSTQRGPTGRAGPPSRGAGLSEAATKLGISEESLRQALRDSGGPPPDMEKAAASLGISVEELQAAMPERRPRPRPQRSGS